MPVLDQRSLTKDNLQVCGNRELAYQLTQKVLLSVSSKTFFTMQTELSAMHDVMKPGWEHNTIWGIQVGEQIQYTLYSYQVSNMAQ